MLFKKEKTVGTVRIPHWILPVVMAVLGEAILHIWTAEAIVFGRFIAILAFALGFGGVLGLLCSFLPGKYGKWTAVAVGVLQVVIYFAEYLINDAFHTFMSVGTIQTGAGGVVSTYLGVVLKAIGKNWWRIALLSLPVIAYAVLAKPGKIRWRMRGILAAAAVVLFFGAVGIVNAAGLDAEKFEEAYSFDGAVRSFGLITGLCLDVVSDPSVVNSELEFEIPQTQPTTPTPAETTAPPSEDQNPESTEDTTPPETEPVVYGEHTMGLDFAKLAEEAQYNTIAAMHSYVASLTPAKENEYTGLFEGKNLIFITAEAFTGQVIDPELTPTLYRLHTKGIEFTDYYQPSWGASTTGGEYSNLAGQVPVDGTCMQEAIAQEFFLTIGRQLQERGYSSAAFHNNTYTYYERHRTHTLFGYDYFMGYGNGIEKGVAANWPQSDLEMIDFTVPMYIDKQPFSVYYMTVSGHSKYTQQGNAMSAKNYDKVAHLDCSEPIKCYLAANLELENALTSLMKQLEDAGIADDTVIVIAADHYPYGLRSSTTWETDKNYLQELFGAPLRDYVRDRNTLIIWSGSIEDMDIKVETPTFSLDILPTLLNLFGVEYDSRLLVGRDALSDEMPLAFWSTTGSWVTENGYYEGYSDVFTPAQGVEVEEGYVDAVKMIVRNKIKYSKGISYYDYYNYVYEALQELKELKATKDLPI